MSIASEITRINTNIAAAYSSCSDKGATLPQTQDSANLADTIDSIPEGGGVVTESDVNFYDYDGTLLYSYSFYEAIQLVELPALPMHTGLMSVEWTHTLQQIQTAAQNSQNTDVGALYTTNDGSTRLYITIPNGKNLTVPLRFTGNVTIDWGDGTVEQTSSPASHTYAPVSYSADYVIKITGIQGIGDGDRSLFNNDIKYSSMLTKVEVGSNVALRDYAFYNCCSLETVVLSPTVSMESSAYTFYGCKSLKNYIAANLPRYEYAFGYCYLLKKVISKNTPSFVGDSWFYHTGIESMKINQAFLGIGQSTFYGCRSLRKVIIPSSVSSIGASAFGQCEMLFYIDLTDYDDPSALPALINSNAFSGIPTAAMIVVRNQSMLDAFTVATNWSSWSDRFIIKGQ